MANPQKENGYTAIANEIVEELVKARLNGTEMAVVLFIIRKTYGFNKTKDAISISQFVNSLWATRRAIIKALAKLKVVNIITLVNKGTLAGNANVWAFNKNYDTWNLVVNKTTLVHKKVRGSVQKGKKVVNKRAHTKDNNKIHITKERQKTLLEQIEPYKSKYAPSLIEKFILYWSETNAAGKERWQLEKTWNIDKRLQRWKRQQEEWDRKKVPPDPEPKRRENTDNGFSSIGEILKKQI